MIVYLFRKLSDIHYTFRNHHNRFTHTFTVRFFSCFISCFKLSFYSRFLLSKVIHFLQDFFHSFTSLNHQVSNHFQVTWSRYFNRCTIGFRVTWYINYSDRIPRIKLPRQWIYILSIYLHSSFNQNFTTRQLFRLEVIQSPFSGYSFTGFTLESIQVLVFCFLTKQRFNQFQFDRLTISIFAFKVRYQ